MAELSIFPIDKGESLSEFVSRVIDLIDRSGITYRVSPMGTILEAQSLEEILNLINSCFKALQLDCNRIIINLKVDYRKGTESRLESKILSVEQKLGRPIQKI